MAIILSFRDLEVYKLAREQAKLIFITTKKFPKEEKYSLTDRSDARRGQSMLWLLRLGQGDDIRQFLLTKLTRRWEKRWKPKRGWTTPLTVTTLIAVSIVK